MVRAELILVKIEVLFMAYFYRVGLEGGGHFGLVLDPLLYCECQYFMTFLFLHLHDKSNALTWQEMLKFRYFPNDSDIEEIFVLLTCGICRLKICTCRCQAMRFTGPTASGYAP